MFKFCMFKFCPHFRGTFIYCIDSIFGTQQSVRNTEVSLFQCCPLRGVPLYIVTSQTERPRHPTRCCDLMYDMLSSSPLLRQAEIGVLKYLGVVGVKAGRSLLYSAGDVAKMFAYWKSSLPEFIRQLCKGKVRGDRHVFKMVSSPKLQMYTDSHFVLR